MLTRDKKIAVDKEILSHPKSKILVVDDVPENLRLLKTLLKSEGYDVRFAPSGQFALASLSRFMPDLILLDIMMPEMDGYTVCEQLKSNPSTEHIPVIFLSALAEGRDKAKGFDLGAVDYITKPFESTEVLARVAIHLKLTHLSQQLQQQNQALVSQNYQLEQAERETRLLLQVTQCLTEEASWQDALAKVLVLICDRILWDYAEAWIPTEDSTMLRCLMPASFPHSPFQEFCQASQSIYFQEGEGLPGRIWSTKQPEWIDDCSVQDESFYIRQKLAKSAGIKAAFGLPIMVEGLVMVVIVFYHTKATECQTHLVALAKAISIQLGLLIERKQREAQIRKQAKNLERALYQLQETQTQLIQSEKMSSLGQLVAGVSHEINNPVSFIAGNIDYLENYIQDLTQIFYLYQQNYPHPPEHIRQTMANVELDFVLSDLPNVLLSMRSGTDRIVKIVSSLRHFAHLDEAQYKSVNLHEEIESVLTLLSNRLKLRSPHEKNAYNPPQIAIERDYNTLPKIECFPGELNQAFMQIAINAIDALQERYEKDLLEDTSRPYSLTVRTRMQENGDRIQVEIMDNGIGIPDEIQSRIFDPFFTTKPVGQGTGMGMAISYQIIVDKHKGTLQYICEPHQTTSIVTLPQHQLPESNHSH